MSSKVPADFRHVLRADRPMKVGWIVWVLVNLIVLAGSVAGLLSPLIAQNKPEVWVRENYHSALGLIFQERICSDTRQGPETRWTTCIRIISGHEKDFETMLVMEKQL